MRMDQVFIHRGIVVPKGTRPDQPLTVKNSQDMKNDPTIKGSFIMPSLSTQESIQKARQSAARWTNRYTSLNPDLEPLVLSLKVSRETFSLLKDRLAIYYLGGTEGPIQTFDHLLREAQETETQGDPGITLNGEGLSPEDMRQLELSIGSKNSNGDFVFMPYDEYIIREGGSIRENGEKNV